MDANPVFANHRRVNHLENPPEYPTPNWMGRAVRWLRDSHWIQGVFSLAITALVLFLAQEALGLPFVAIVTVGTLAWAAWEVVDMIRIDARRAQMDQIADQKRADYLQMQKAVAGDRGSYARLSNLDLNNSPIEDIDHIPYTIVKGRDAQGRRFVFMKVQKMDEPEGNWQLLKLYEKALAQAGWAAIFDDQNLFNETLNEWDWGTVAGIRNGIHNQYCLSE